MGLCVSRKMIRTGRGGGEDLDSVGTCFYLLIGYTSRWFRATIHSKTKNTRAETATEFRTERTRHRFLSGQIQYERYLQQYTCLRAPPSERPRRLAHSHTKKQCLRTHSLIGAGRPEPELGRYTVGPSPLLSQEHNERAVPDSPRSPGAIDRHRALPDSLARVARTRRRYRVAVRGRLTLGSGRAVPGRYARR